ncbi:MAG: hypothetical protein RJA70_4820 [Pseudomonadota bacterium]
MNRSGAALSSFASCDRLEVGLQDALDAGHSGCFHQVTNGPRAGASVVAECLTTLNEILDASPQLVLGDVRDREFAVTNQRLNELALYRVLGSSVAIQNRLTRFVSTIVIESQQRELPKGLASRHWRTMSAIARQRSEADLDAARSFRKEMARDRSHLDEDDHETR